MTHHTHHTQHRTGRAGRDSRTPLISRMMVALLTIALWLRGQSEVDDRGSDSTEKAFMVILAIGIGTAVSAAAVAFVATKAALFK